MLWTSIGIEPAALRPAAGHGTLATYCLSLPLVADGRLAFVQLRANGDLARVIRYAPDEDALPGTIRFLTGQWHFVWDLVAGQPAGHPLVRFSGNRFRNGDPVCLRQDGKPLLIYRVCPAQLAAARQGAWPSRP